MAVINRGHGQGLFICKTCGFVSEEYHRSYKHKNKYGYDCVNKYLTNLSIGHTFNSDILKIELPQYNGEYDSTKQWISTLYAILEGASSCLDIDRGDINGCISYVNERLVFILYDESAGGAGHVKRIASEMDDVLKEALNRVDGSCGCSDDTSCYGCLRNYGNQFEHEHLIRGAAKEYLEWLINEKCDYGENRMWNEKVDNTVELCNDGRNMHSETSKEIWDSLLEDCEDEEETNIINNIAAMCSDNMAKPIYCESFTIPETKEDVFTDLIWPERKVILFLKESYEDYKVALKTGWYCYCTAEDIDIDEFIDRIGAK